MAHRGAHPQGAQGHKLKPSCRVRSDSLILPLSTGVTEEQAEKQDIWLLTEGWITSGKTLGSSESSVRSEKLCECEIAYPQVNDPLSALAAGSPHL